MHSEIGVYIVCVQIGLLVAEGCRFESTPAPNVSIGLRVEDLDKKSVALVDDTMKLPHLRVHIVMCAVKVLVCI